LGFYRAPCAINLKQAIKVSTYIWDKITELLLNAMRFGSEDDFRVGIKELQWIIKTFGKASKREIEMVSSKYNFPVDLLRQGLKGLVFPDDHKISKSKWFPILYSWIIQRDEISNKLLRLQIDYRRAIFSFIRTFVLLIAKSELIIFVLKDYLDFLGLFTLVVTFVLFFVALFFEMKNPLSDNKINLEEYTHQIRQRGLGQVIQDNEDFLKTYCKYVVYAGGIVKRSLNHRSKLQYLLIILKMDL